MAMVGLDEQKSTAENYRRFATDEAMGRSAAYQVLAEAVANSADVLAFLQTLPASKRQPNLLFAAARLLLRRVPGIDDLRDIVAVRPADLAAVMLTRRTQTNEPARCATLLPALALFDEPLAIIEVGASAGLCLQLANYSYDYGATRIQGRDPHAPTLHCDILGGSPRLSLPDVRWAGGIDLNPLDPSDPDDRAWLRCLVWPDQVDRATRLSSALETAIRHPIAVREGDLMDAVPRLLTEIPNGTRPVVFHSAVLAYVNATDRARFSAQMSDLGVTWLANEAPGIVADPHRKDYDTTPFVLTLNGDPVGFTHPHGDWIDWIKEPKHTDLRPEVAS